MPARYVVDGWQRLRWSTALGGDASAAIARLAFLLTGRAKRPPFYALRAQTREQLSEARHCSHCRGGSEMRHPFSAVVLAYRLFAAAVPSFAAVATSTHQLWSVQRANKNHNKKQPGCSIHIYIYTHTHTHTHSTRIKVRAAAMSVLSSSSSGRMKQKKK